MATEHGRLWSEAVVDVAYAGKVLNMEKNAVYKAVGRGDIPSIKIGNRFRIPTAPLRQMLGLTEQDAPRKGSVAA